MQGASSKVWVADQGSGTYRNPILFADYSDPDILRVVDRTQRPLRQASRAFFHGNNYVDSYGLHEGDRTDLVVLGRDYAFVGIRQTSTSRVIIFGTCKSLFTI